MGATASPEIMAAMHRMYKPLAPMPRPNTPAAQQTTDKAFQKWQDAKENAAANPNNQQLANIRNEARREYAKQYQNAFGEASPFLPVDTSLARKGSPQAMSDTKAAGILWREAEKKAAESGDPVDVQAAQDAKKQYYQQYINAFGKVPEPRSHQWHADHERHADIADHDEDTFTDGAMATETRFPATPDTDCCGDNGDDAIPEETGGPITGFDTGLATQGGLQAKPYTKTDAIDTLKSRAMGSDPGKLSYDDLQKLANGTNPAFPPAQFPGLQAAAKEIAASPNLYARYCGTDGSLTKKDLDKLQTDTAAAAVDINNLTPEQTAKYNGKPANDPSFFYKDGEHTPQYDIAMKAAANNPGRAADLAAAFGDSPSELKRAMGTLLNNKALFGHDHKASIGELRKLAGSTSDNVNTKQAIQAAKTLVANYDANGGKNGPNALFDAAGKDEKFDTKEWEAAGSKIATQPAPTAHAASDNTDSGNAGTTTV